MSNYIHLFETQAAHDAVYNGSEYTEPWVGLVTANNTLSFNKEPLTFKILSSGSIGWQNYGWSNNTGVTIQYSKNGGEWTNLTSAYGDANAPLISVSAGDVLKFKGTLRGNNTGNSSYYTKFKSIDCDFIISGDLLSLCEGVTSFRTYTFEVLFSGCNVIEANKLILPKFSSTHIFESMFASCTKLVLPPELPVTDLSSGCYYSMFSGCTSLTTAPELPATTLVTECYRNMFQNCTNLSSVTCLATDISASNCVNNWLNNVSSTGTFTKAASMTSWPSGASGIPTGWTVQDAS